MPLNGLSHAHLRPGTDQAGEHELQTDIMRFLAILALCLMAVFALVQGLPQAGEQVREDPRPALRAQIQVLLQKVRELQTQRAELSDELAGLRRSRNRVQGDLSDTELRLRTAVYRLQRSDARLRELDLALNAGTQAVSALQQRHSGEQRELQRVERRLEEVRLELEQRLEESRPDPVPIPAAVRQSPQSTEPVIPEPEPDEPVQPQAPDQPEGFSLHFASASSLKRLVAEGRVGFYARLPEGFWRLHIEGGRQRFDRSAPPGSLYAMTGDTVPDGFRTSLLRSSGRSIDGRVDWGVTLPSEIAAGVQSAMQGRSGGALVIHADGRVEPSRARGS